jgi:hypothetical protein
VALEDTGDDAKGALWRQQAMAQGPYMMVRGQVTAVLDLMKPFLHD